MALLTERGLKRHPVAVILVDSLLSDVGKNAPTAEFEWFKTVDAATEFAEQNKVFAEADVAAYTALTDATEEDGGSPVVDPAMAYLVIIIPDTATLEVGEASVFPETDATKEWRDDIIADITVLFEKKAAAKAPSKSAPVVKPKRRLVGG